MIIVINEKIATKKINNNINPSLEDTIKLLKDHYGTCGLSICAYDDENDIKVRTGLYLEEDIGFYVHTFININPDNPRILRCEKLPLNDYINKTLEKYSNIQISNTDSEWLIRIDK